MEASQSQQNTKSQSSETTTVTKKRVRDSKLMVFSLIVIFILAFLYLVSTVTIYFLTIQTINSDSPDQVVNLTETVSNYIHIDVATAIGTIATAVCARYLARETASNITGKGYTTTTTDVNKEK